MLERIGALYDIEAAISRQPRNVRYAARQRESRPRVEAFRLWCERQLTPIPGKGDLAKAMRYGLTRWASFTLRSRPLSAFGRARSLRDRLPKSSTTAASPSTTIASSVP